MKSSVACLCVAALGLGVGACGGETSTPKSHPESAVTTKPAPRQIICTNEATGVMKCNVPRGVRFHMSDLPEACREGPCRVHVYDDLVIHVGRASFSGDECRPGRSGHVICPKRN